MTNDPTFGKAFDKTIDKDADRPSSELSISDRVLLLGGADFWHTNAIERARIPALHLSDGPSGVRGARSVGTTSVSFPCGIAIGATFDVNAAIELAEALADECLERGVHVLLGPTVNLHRHPLGGRHFECYSEDPVLTARLAVAYVRALQARGVAATIKHFVANDTEFERHTISSDANERVLRELYLLPFEAAVYDAGTWAIMAAYNKVNGTYAAEHEGLLQNTLRDEWGFDGVVVSDWFGTQSTVASARAGLDLEMPGPPVHYGQRLLEAVESGAVDEATIDGHVARLRTLMARTGAGDASRHQQARSTIPERQEVARRLATESFVLLKNDDSVLPFSLKPGDTLAVIGPNASETAGQGGGSARVNAVGSSTVLGALTERLEPEGINVVFERGCVTWVVTPTLEADLTLDYHAGSGFDSEDFDEVVVHQDLGSHGSFTWLGEPVPEVAALQSGGWVLRARTQLVPKDGGDWVFTLQQVGKARLLVDGHTVVDASEVVGNGKSFFGFGTEEVFGTVALEQGRPYELVVEYTPTPGFALAGLLIGAVPPVGTDQELMRRAEALASRSAAVVCVIGTSPEWETEGHDRKSMSLVGPQDELVRRLVRANPRTCVLINAGSPVLMDWAEETPSIAQIWFAGEQAGNGVADVLLGASDPGGRLPTTIPIRLEDTPAFPFYPGEHGHAPYGEGLFVGYRHYDSHFVAPRFCFGHGLSFTTFAYSDLEVSAENEPCGERLSHGLEGDAIFSVSATITNEGPRAGTEVVQCYVEDLGPVGSEPVQQLRAFEKIRLEPGAGRRVTLHLTERDFASYDEERRGFYAREGQFVVHVGRSSQDRRLSAMIELHP